MGYSRRGFLAETCAFGAVSSLFGVQRPVSSTRSNPIDKSMTALLSGVRTDGADGTEVLKKRIDAILSMRPLPARCLVLPESCLPDGNDSGRSDIRELRRMFAADGVDAIVAEKGCVHLVQTPGCDIMLLDCRYGAFAPAVQEYLAANLPRWKRPVFICASNPPQWMQQGREVSLVVQGTPFVELLEAVPCLAGYIHGGTGRWSCAHERAGRNRFTTMLSLPSAGSAGDIGHVVLRTSHGGAVAELHQDGFRPLQEHPSGGVRTDWSAMVAANRGAKCRFDWSAT